MNDRFKSRVIILVFAILLLAGLDVFWGEKIRNSFYHYTSSMEQLIWKMASAIDFVDYEEIEKAKAIKLENERLLAELGVLQSLKHENDFLRRSLKLKDIGEYEFIDAEVIGGARFSGNGFEYDDSIVIRRGKIDGVRDGFTVVTADKLLVGKIKKAYENYSRVELFTNKENLVDVQIAREKIITVKTSNDSVIEGEGENEEEVIDGEVVDPVEEFKTEVVKDVYVLDKNIAISKGEGGQKSSLEMFPKDEELEEGALVVTSSLTGSYPSGFVVGRVKNVKKIDTESFKEAEIVPAFDLKLLDKVLVLKGFEIIIDD